jgi:4-aminobutyrate aminotransferase
MMVKTFYQEIVIVDYNGKYAMENKRYYPKIIIYPPGPKTRELVTRDYQITSSSVNRITPLSIASAEGLFLIDLEGNRFIDLTSGWLTTNLCHNHPEIMTSLENQMKKLISYPYHRMYYQKATEFSEELAKIVPGNFKKNVLFTASRDDAVEAALKMANWNTRRQVYLTHIGSYHGESLSTLSLTSDKAQRQMHIPPSLNVVHIPFPNCYRCPLRYSAETCHSPSCLTFLEDAFDTIVPPENIAAFILEPIQIYNGVIVPPKEYMKKFWGLLKKKDIPLIVNEGFTALGRTGSWLAINQWHIVPDAVIFAESLASGLPLTALIAQKDMMDWYPGSHSSTLGGNPLAIAAAQATLHTIQKENLMSIANREGLYLKKRLKELQVTYPEIGDVRGQGLLVGIEIVQDPETKKPDPEKADKILEECWRKGVLLGLCGKSTLLFAPPLLINRETLNIIFEILEAVITNIHNEDKLK